MGTELTTTANRLSISTLTQELSVLTDHLQPASDDAIAARLLSLTRAGLSFPPGLDPKRAGQIYGFAMKGISIEALKRATEKLIKGDVPNHNRNFIPTPPAFAAIAKAEAREMHTDAARIRETIDALQLGYVVGPVKTDEAKAAVRNMVAGVKAAAAETRESSGIAAFTEAELNKLFRNKQIETPAEPAAAGFDDREWNRRYDEEQANARDDQ